MRNIWCPDYSRCLDKAVASGQGFDCRGCKREHDQGLKNDVHDLFGCCLLLAALYFPEVYRRYWEDKKIQRFLSL